MRLRGNRTRLINAGGRGLIPGLNHLYLNLIRCGLFCNLELRWDGSISDLTFNEMGRCWPHFYKSFEFIKVNQAPIFAGAAFYNLPADALGMNLRGERLHPSLWRHIAPRLRDATTVSPRRSENALVKWGGIPWRWK
jgi:hypothetical protein